MEIDRKEQVLVVSDSDSDEYVECISKPTKSRAARAISRAEEDTLPPPTKRPNTTRKKQTVSPTPVSLTHIKRTSISGESAIFFDKILVIEDAPVINEKVVDVNTVVVEARISFDVPTEERSLENSNVAKIHEMAVGDWQMRRSIRQMEKRSNFRKRRIDRREEAEAAGQGPPPGGWPSLWGDAFGDDDSEASDGEPEPEKPEYDEHTPIDLDIIETIQEHFKENPFDALRTLIDKDASSVTYHLSQRISCTVSELRKTALYKSISKDSARCFSPASLGNETASRTFALVRALCQQKRATLKPDQPDSGLWGNLVRQPPRVLRTVWSFASTKKMPLSAYSLAALEEEMGASRVDNSCASSSSVTPASEKEKVEESPFVAFAKALIADGSKSRSIAAFKKDSKSRIERKGHRIERRIERAYSRFQKLKKKCDNRGISFDPKQPKSKTGQEALSRLLKEGNDAEMGGKPSTNSSGKNSTATAADKDSDESDSENDEDDGEKEPDHLDPDNNGEKEPDHLDPSQFSFKFDTEPFTVDPQSGRVIATLTVCLAPGAFSSRRESKYLSVQKQRVTRKLNTETFYGLAYGSATTDQWQHRDENPTTKLLGKVFPERWEVNEESPVFLAAHQRLSTPLHVPWQRTKFHTSSVLPRRRCIDCQRNSTTGAWENIYNMTEEELADKVLAHEDEQAVPPKDDRVPPPWVERPLRGSTDKGNGGWAAIGVQGKDLVSDLLSDSWRLPPLFPHLPNSVDMLMEELENLGHRTMSHPTGMTVQLRDYQLHTISFMIDQERLPGGIHSHLFAPIVTKHGHNIWYSPILDVFRKTAPPRVCGGFLADEMGLGKTVMVIGLILSNPAPPKFLLGGQNCDFVNVSAAPAQSATQMEDGLPSISSSSSLSSSSASSSGSSSSTAISFTPSSSSLLAAAAAATSSAGSNPLLIRSRATLVVCNVSLVGQWYDECASKLEDNHLSVYRYYGANRTRDPSVLANYDIVVTTFAVLASDFGRMVDEQQGEGVGEDIDGDANNNEEGVDVEMAASGGGGSKKGKGVKKAPKSEKEPAKKKKKSRSFKALKSGEDANPAAKVHWWRIVLDESHLVKDPSTAANKACTYLTSGRRWCVSGTPIINKIEDLIGQFRFLGLDPLGNPASFAAVSSHSSKLLALLRRILIRHSKSQRILRMNKNYDDSENTIACSSSSSNSSSSSSSNGSSFSDSSISSVGDRGEMKEQSLLPLPPLETVVEFLDFAGATSTASFSSSKLVSAGGDDLGNGKKAKAATTSQYSESSTYAAMERRTKKRYLCLRRKGENAVRKATLVITERMLRPLRQACSGGIMTTCLSTVSGSTQLPSSFSSSSSSCSSSSSSSLPSSSLLTVGDIARTAKETEETDSDKDDEGGGERIGSMVMETKLKALIGWLLKVKDSDPTSKCLVFTQFKHSMAWLSEELPKRGFTFRSLDGSMTQKAREDALLAFRDDPPTTVFLLSVRAGAVGINLTEANHVFFMEPLLNSAIEKQAIGRVHRMGQRRAVTVVKFVMKHSVESRLHDLATNNPARSGGCQEAAIKISKKLAGASEGVEVGGDGAEASAADTSVAVLPSSKLMATVGYLHRNTVSLNRDSFDVLFGVVPKDL